MQDCMPAHLHAMSLEQTLHADDVELESLDASTTDGEEPIARTTVRVELTREPTLSLALRDPDGNLLQQCELEEDQASACCV